MHNIYNYDNSEDFTLDTATAIEDFLIWKLQENDSVSMALSGGNSPKLIYEQLAKSGQIEWDKVELFMVDERYVSQNAQESNFRMIEESLLSRISPIKFFHGFNTDLPLKEAAEEYDQLLESRGNRPFDLVLLGMGKDGHTASLFPKSKALNEKTKLATSSKSPDKMDRLTITMPAIFAAEKVMFLVRGKEKKEKVSQLLQENVSDKDFPAKMVMTHENVEIYTDFS